MMTLYLHFVIRLHGVVLNYLRTGTTLPFYLFIIIIIIKLNSVALVRERTIPTERPPLVGEVSGNLCG
jgi:hypothetical protein